MRILIGSLSHESNSFNPKFMRLADFAPVYGQEVLKILEAGHQAPLLGIYRVLKEAGAEVVPTILARATPGGLVSYEAYQAMKARFLEELRQAGPLDGICLHLHGSMVVERVGDAEGDLLTAIRRIVGEDVPIVASLDMHATITSTMLQRANGFVGFRTAPHVDTVETGERAARLLLDSLTNGYPLVTRAVGLPILISGEQSESAKPPMCDLIQRMQELDELHGILSTSLFLGFPWVDVPYNQGAALVVATSPELAEEKALALAKQFWSKRAQFRFTTEAYPFAEALEVALRVERGPVCIADCGDNPGAGGSQDIVQPLEILLERGLDNVLFGAIADADAYEYCLRQELGSSFDLSLGRLSVEPDALPLRAQAELLRVGELGTMPAVAVRIGGIDVMISRDRVMMLDPQDVRQLGLEPQDYRLVVLKSGYLDPKYEAIASRRLLALTRGYTNQNFAELEFRRLTRPMYPLDRDFHFDPRAYLLPAADRGGQEK